LKLDIPFNNINSFENKKKALNDILLQYKTQKNPEYESQILLYLSGKNRK
jgi:hypothetical protein